MRNKPHKKVRTGCTTCKRRRVKCDERKPTCSNCQDRNTECLYPSSLSPPSLHSVSAPINRQLELLLAHHWCTQTCQSFTSTQVSLLRDHAIVAAQQDIYVMDAIYALTAAHIASAPTSNAPSSGQDYVQAASHYHAQTVSALQTAITTSSCGTSVFIASLLTLATAVVLPLLHREAGAKNCVLEQMYGLMKGIHTVVDMNTDEIRMGPCGSIFGQLSSPDCVPVAGDAERLRRLRQLGVKYAAGNSRLICEIAIDELEKGYLFNRKRAISWVGKVGPDFIDAVKKEDPYPNLVLLYWAVLLCRLDGMWWAKYAGRILVKELTDRFGCLYDDSWSEAIEWVGAELRGTSGDERGP